MFSKNLVSVNFGLLKNNFVVIAISSFLPYHAPNQENVKSSIYHS